MKNLIPVILFILSLVSLGACNKETNLSHKSYQLDSVSVSYLDTNLIENAHFFTYPVTTGYATSYFDLISAPFAIGGYHFRENGDSMVTELYTESCANSPNTELLNYSYIIGHKFNFVTNMHLIGCYGQDGTLSTEQYIYYDTDNSLHSIRNSVKWRIGGNIYNEVSNQSSFIYSGNDINSITVNHKEYVNYGLDSTSFNFTNAVYYPHLINNQSDVIGIDANDIVLSVFLNSLFFSTQHIINKKASFNTRCRYLIERIHFEQIPQFTNTGIDYNPIFIQNQAADLKVLYNFDANHYARISSMIIYLQDINNSILLSFNPVKYTFYYKD
ncbi:MAG: hypothetical protein U0T77_01815 [Chitinophagales bacterium]